MSAPKTSSTSFADTVATLQAKVDSLHLEQRVDELTVATERAIRRAVEQAGELAHDRRDQVVTLLDRAGAAVDQRTEGRYAAQLTRVRSQLLAGVDKLAAKRASATSSATAGAAPAQPYDGPQDAPRGDSAA